MTKQELVEALNELGVNPNYYSLDGGRWIEGIILEATTNYYDNNKEYPVWNVFRYERERNDECSFSSESEALQDIYDRLMQYQVYKKKR